MLGELEGEGRVVIGDLEAGTGTLLRLPPNGIDTVIVVAQPTAKALEIARRALAVAATRARRVVVIANRIRSEDDVATVRAIAGDHEVVAVPDDPAILAADRDGIAPLEAAPDSPAMRAVAHLAGLLMGRSHTVRR